MADEWDLTDEQMDAWLEEWREVDRMAAAYLAERHPEVLEPLAEDEAREIDALIETFAPTDALADEVDVEGFASVMALQHADWLGLAFGVVRRGPGAALDPEVVLADIEALDDVEGEVEDPEGTLGVLTMALLVLTEPWQSLEVLDQDEQLTPYGVWALPRAFHRYWSR